MQDNTRETIINIMIKQFNKTEKQPIFEIELDGEYYTYYIQVDKEGLHLGGATNSGFYKYNLDSVQWDIDFGLSEHLQELYDIAYNDASQQNIDLMEVF